MSETWPKWIEEDVKRMVSVDVETSGPNPADYALLSIGACWVAEPEKRFYAELQPTTMHATEGAFAIHHLDLQQLAQSGQPPETALRGFADWLAETIGPEEHPIFVGFNAPFDWMFVCDYFHRFLGENPFGHSALDIKSFYMGSGEVSWRSTSMNQIAKIELQHNALQDACDQAALFRKIVLHAV